MKYAKIKINIVWGSPTAITNDLPSVVCWVSQMASSFISHFLAPTNLKVSLRRNFVVLLRQRKSNQKEGDPGLPPLRGTLRCSTGQAAAELARSATRPRAQTVLADYP
jgi:hypothetical protein